MSLHISKRPSILRRPLKPLCAVALAIFCSAASTHGAEIFVANLTGPPLGRGGSISEYNLDGTPISAPLISSELSGPRGIAISGTNLFVANDTGGVGFLGEFTTSGANVNDHLIPGLSIGLDVAIFGTSLYVSDFVGNVGKYTTSGTVISESLASQAGTLWGIAISGDGSRLFVANFDYNTVGEYDAVTGATINTSLITGLNAPTGITLSGSKLFVANSANGVVGAGSIGAYNLDGTAVNAALVTGLSNPQDVTEFGGNLYVTDNGNHRVGEYDATTGATVNAALITGFSYPTGIAVVPEPSTLELVCAAAMAFAFVAWHKTISRRRFTV